MNITEKIFQLEKDHKLFESQLAGIYFWKLIRLDIYENIMQQTKQYGEAQKGARYNIVHLAKRANTLLFNSTLRSWQRDFNRREVIIFRHPRKVYHKKEFIDIYTKEIENELSQKKVDFGIIDFPENLEHKTNYDDRTSNIESPVLLLTFIHGFFLRHIIIKNILTHNEKEYISFLNQKINDDFAVDINLMNTILKNIAKFKSRKNFFSKLLKRTKPKTIYLTSHYSRHDLIAAANDLDIKVIEIQHGIITPYHLGYSFVDNKKVPYFPDELILYGSLWSQMTNMPIHNSKIQVRCFKYLYEKKADVIKKRKNNVITIISQGTISKDLFSFAIELAELMKDYNFNYKLHPGEIAQWKEKVSKYIPKNLTVIYDETSIHNLFGESTHVIGVYSTAVYEALYFDCKIGILTLPGYEYMSYLYTSKFAYLINNIEEAIDFIEDLDFNTQNLDLNTIFGGQ